MLFYTLRPRILAQLTIGAYLCAPGAANSFEIDLPVACALGSDCAIQQYVDQDPGPGAVDYFCGAQTYDGHDGTDFRLPTLRDMENGVAVVAAAHGVVSRMRDGVADTKYQPGSSDVADQECGNGVLIDHGDGWSTQYCHMKQGSVAVSPGDRVEAGSRLGEIGLSGQTEFPHLEFIVRRGDDIIDPFRGEPPAEQNGVCLPRSTEAALWTKETLEGLRYRDPHVLNVGFSDAPVTMDQVDSGVHVGRPLDARAPALVFFGRAIGVREGDRQRLTVTAPDGSVLVQDETEPANRAKAQIFAFAGKRRLGERWEPGAYLGRYSIIRDGSEVAAAQTTVNIE